MKCVDPVVPISRIISRLEKQKASLSEDLRHTSWWQWKRRYVLSGAITAYGIEINALLELSAKTQPFFREHVSK